MSQIIGDKILKVLEPKGMTIVEITEAVGEKYCSVSSALRTLKKERKVINRCGVWWFCPEVS